MIFARPRDARVDGSSCPPRPVVGSAPISGRSWRHYRTAEVDPNRPFACLLDHLVGAGEE